MPKTPLGVGATQNPATPTPRQVQPSSQQGSHKSNSSYVHEYDMVRGGAERCESKGKLDVLEERLRAIEGADTFESINATQLCVISNVFFPPKFKVPVFEQYDETSCPRNHLITHIQEEKLLIHCFQDSLTGPASRWYM